MVAFTLSLAVALNTNIKGFAVGLLVGGSVRSLYCSSELDTVAHEFVRSVHTRTISVPGHGQCTCRKRGYIHGNSQKSVCKHTSWMAVKDGGRISTQHREIFIAQVAVFFLELNREKQNKTRKKKQQQQRKFYTRKCDFNLLKNN